MNERYWFSKLKKLAELIRIMSQLPENEMSEVLKEAYAIIEEVEAADAPPSEETRSDWNEP